MIFSFKSVLLGLCAALALQGCSTAQPTEQAHPALWLVSDADTNIYLLGTMHALPDHVEWDGGAVQQAITAADTLILELAPAETAKVGAEFTRLSPRTAPMPVKDRLSPPAQSAYSALGVTDRLPLSQALDDWALMLILGQQASKRAGLSTTNGVESQLSADFSAAGKRISGLETAQQQLMIFETLPASTQRALLNNALIKSRNAAQDIHTLVGAWAKGDIDEMHRKIAEDTNSAPIAHKRLIDDRNQRWATWTVQRMDSPGTILMAVGAGHLVGDQGLPALLAAQGLTVTRIQ